MRDETHGAKRARNGPGDEWVPAHRRLMKGPKRGLPRGVRFVLLELSMEARAKGGVVDLSVEWNTERAVHDLIGGNRREIKQALKAFTKPDEDGIAPIEIVRDETRHQLVVKKWGRWALGKTSTERVQELRERQRGYQGGDLVYFVRRAKDGLIKIGHSDNVTRRLSDLQSELSDEITLLATTSGGETVEKSLHDRFARFRIVGGWFTPDESILNYIATLDSSRNVTRVARETPQRREEESTGEESREDPPLAPQGGEVEGSDSPTEPAEPVVHDGGKRTLYDDAWRLWRTLYEQSRRNYGRYLEVFVQDDRVVQRLAHRAEELAGGNREGAIARLRHWFVSYLREDGDLSCHANARHPLRLIERRLPTYGDLPKPVTRTKKPKEPEPPPLSQEEHLAALERARSMARGIGDTAKKETTG